MEASLRGFSVTPLRSAPLHFAQNENLRPPFPVAVQLLNGVGDLPLRPERTHPFLSNGTTPATDAASCNAAWQSVHFHQSAGARRALHAASAVIKVSTHGA